MNGDVNGNVGMSLRRVLGLALLGGMWLPGVAQSAGNGQEEKETQPSAAAASGRPDSLERAWIEAVDIAHGRKGGRESSVVAHEGFSVSKSTPLPTVTADESRFWPDETPLAIVTFPGFTGLPATLSTFTGARGGADVARTSRSAAQAEERHERLDLKMSVADAYVDVLRATRVVRVATRSVTSLASHLQTVSNLGEKGLVARDDLLASRVALAGARQREVRARNDLYLAAASYNRVLARPFSDPVMLEDLPAPPAAGDLNRLTARAFKERPGLVALAEQAQALHEEAKGVRASAWPFLGVNGGYNHIENTFLQREHIWSIGLVGTWNLFDRGLTGQRARDVEDQADDASARWAEAMNDVSLQVRRAWFALDQSLSRLEGTRRIVAPAEVDLKVARDCYGAGTGSNTEVLDAETLLARSSGDRDNAVYDAVIAAFRLQRIIGNLGEEAKGMD